VTLTELLDSYVVDQTYSTIPGNPLNDADNSFFGKCNDPLTMTLAARAQDYRQYSELVDRYDR